MNYAIYLIICVLITVFDAFRDAWIIGRKSNISWLLWHVVKWLSFYPQFVIYSYLYYIQGGYLFFIVVAAIFCKLVWVYIYRVISQ